jgi:hypothetical protein
MISDCIGEGVCEFASSSRAINRTVTSGRHQINTFRVLAKNWKICCSTCGSSNTAGRLALGHASRGVLPKMGQIRGRSLRIAAQFEERKEWLALFERQKEAARKDEESGRSELAATEQELGRASSELLNLRAKPDTCASPTR